MIWLYILLVILILLIVLLFLPINLKVEYNEDILVEIKILFFKFKFDEKKENKKKIRYSKKKQKENKGSIYSLIKEKGIIQTISFYCNILKSVKGIIKNIFERIQIENLDLRIKIGDEYASESAIKYGQACAVVYPATAFLTRFNTPKKYNVVVTPDFLSTKINFYFELLVKTKILDIILVGIYFIKKYSQMTGK